MGSDDGAASVSVDDEYVASVSCRDFLKCVVAMDKQPVYLEVSEACGFDLVDNNDGAGAEDLLGVEEEKGRISAKQDESGNWIVQWNVRRHQEGDFIALCFLGKLIMKQLN